MFYKAAPNTNLKVCVIIPVKDEADNICHCLDALRMQMVDNRTPFFSDYYEILILANNCRDNTYSIIKDYQAKYPTLPLQVEKIVFSSKRANIGTARRFLMDMALNRFLFLKKPRGIIASTDGDTVVDTFWLNGIVKEIDRGCDVVGGEIITEITDSPVQRYYLQDIQYHNLIARLEHVIDPLSHNPWPSHFQCFGASLAVTCELYEKAGRLPSVPFLEDVAFSKALELKDARIRKSPDVKVYTSSRTSGRVERGLSQQLAWFKSLCQEKHELEVESAASILCRLQLKKYLRDCWSKKKIIASPFPFLEKDLHNWMEAEYFGEVWAEAEGRLENIRWFEQWNTQAIEDVITDLNKCVLEMRNALK